MLAQGVPLRFARPNLMPTGNERARAAAASQQPLEGGLGINNVRDDSAGDTLPNAGSESQPTRRKWPDYAQVIWRIYYAAGVSS
jgi:hypothetical protein